MASWVNWGKTVFLWMASQLGKVCFWCQIRCLSVARWYTCVSVFFSFLFAWMGKCYRCHHAFLNAYKSIQHAWRIQARQRRLRLGRMWSGDEKERNARGAGDGGDGGETKQKKLQTVQMRAVSLHVRVFFFFPHYLKKASEVEEETEVLIKMKDCNNSLLLLL